jgi:hypothetical protein
VAVASAPVRLGTDSDTDEEEPPRKRSWLGMFLGVGCLFVVIGGGALGYGGWYAWSRYQAGAAAEPAEPEPAVGAAGTAVEEPAPASAEPEPEPEPPAGPALTFRSASPETKKLSVNCDGTSASGAPEATLALEKASTCTITAIQTDRSRLTAKLSEAEAGSYTCFADGASVCKKD